MVEVTDLLDTVRWPAPEGGKQPLMLQLPVPDDTAPYLVSSSRSFMWIQQTSKAVVRTAVRQSQPGGFGPLWWQVISACHAEGVQRKWGQTARCTLAGVKKVIGFVKEYNPNEPLTLLCSPSVSLKLGKHGTCVVAPWLPGKTVVVIPTDRLLIGNLLLLGDAHWAMVVHNASRTIGIASDVL